MLYKLLLKEVDSIYLVMKHYI